MGFTGNQDINCFGIIAGITIIVVSFFGGLMLLLSADNLGAAQVIFYMMVIPAIGAIIGVAIMLYSMKSSFPGLGVFSKQFPTTERTIEKSYIHEPPSFCASCGAGLSSESIDWVGPLSVKCPYCGAVHPTVKRKV